MFESKIAMTQCLKLWQVCSILDVVLEDLKLPPQAPPTTVVIDPKKQRVGKDS